MIVAFGLAALLLWGPVDEIIKVWIVTLAAGLILVGIAVQDFKTFTIADGAVIAIASLALARRCAAGDTMFAIELDCLLTGGILLAFREIYYRRKGFDGLGLGDVKLAAAAGLLVGASAFAWALLGASLFALGFVALNRFTSVARAGPSLGSTDRLAFGAFLAPVVWGVWVAQHALFLLPFAGS